MVDMFSRYSAGCVIQTKKASEMAEKFMLNWVSIHGSPKSVFSDNGLECNNEAFRDMCENFNIEVITSAAFSPWSCGIVEQHNALLKEIMQNMIADTNCSYAVSLA